MERPIHVESVQIQRATIEVQVMRISDRQMTLSVFRQLPFAPVIDYNDDGPCLTGPIWGRVNYCPDSECKKRLTHIHFVWQLEDQLFRD